MRYIYIINIYRFRSTNFNNFITNLADLINKFYKINRHIILQGDLFEINDKNLMSLRIFISIL